MNVVYCIATRGKVALLKQTLPVTARTLALSETRIVVDVDDDDHETIDLTKDNSFSFGNHVIYNIGPRPDSLGEKYNRIAELTKRSALGDSIFCLGVDDSAMATVGWDGRIIEVMSQFPDGLGVIHYSKPQGTVRFPAIMCVTSEFARHMGFFCPPYFPAWWHDTWIDEVAQLSGRLLWVDGEMFYPDEQGGTRGLRDISYWATFFDITRPLRVQAAEAILEAGKDLPYLRSQRRGNFQPLINSFLQANAHLRDPLGAMQFEKRGFDAPADERYARLKAKADAMMMEIMR
jgi:hypothetical protein